MGLSNHTRKGRPLKMAVISLSKMTQLVATEAERSTRCHLACPLGKANCSAPGQPRMLALEGIQESQIDCTHPFPRRSQTSHVRQEDVGTCGPGLCSSPRSVAAPEAAAVA